MGEVPADVRSGDRRAPHAPSAFPSTLTTPADGAEHFRLGPLPDSLL
jgi:hypothetical protein